MRKMTYRKISGAKSEVYDNLQYGTRCNNKQ